MTEDQGYIRSEADDTVADEEGFGIEAESGAAMYAPAARAARIDREYTDMALGFSSGLLDMALGDAQDALESGIRTAVILSLFTDRLADADDVLPDGADDRRGWWGDVYPVQSGDRIGSRLWLISREKQMRGVLKRAETYALEALQWMIDDGVASDVEVSAQNPADSVLALDVRVLRPDGGTVGFRFANLWEAEHAL